MQADGERTALRPLMDGAVRPNGLTEIINRLSNSEISFRMSPYPYTVLGRIHRRSKRRRRSGGFAAELHHQHVRLLVMVNERSILKRSVTSCSSADQPVSVAFVCARSGDASARSGRTDLCQEFN